jgi:hypothetical protein
MIRQSQKKIAKPMTPIAHRAASINLLIVITPYKFKQSITVHFLNHTPPFLVGVPRSAYHAVLIVVSALVPIVLSK